MIKWTVVAAATLSLLSTAAFAGEPNVAVSEPGLLGLFAGGVVLTIALMRRGRK